MKDAESLAVLAIQVWLTTYAFDGVHNSYSRYLLSVFTPGEFSRLIADASTFIFVADREDYMIGFIQMTVGKRTPLSESKRQAEIEHLYVQEPFHGQGIGSMLLKRAENHLAGLSVPTVWLTTWYGNERARRFYEKREYVDRGETFFELDNERHENRVYIKALRNDP